MLDDALIQQLVAELDQAEKTRTPLDCFSTRFPGMNVEDSYRVGRAWVAKQIAGGNKAIGYRVGGSAVSSQTTVPSPEGDEPLYGTLLHSMQFTAPAGQVLEIPASRFIAPRVGIAIALVLKSPLKGTGVTAADAINATSHVTPAIDISDARIEQAGRPTQAPRAVCDALSDNAAIAGVVLGASDEHQLAHPLTTGQPWGGAVLTHNGVGSESVLACTSQVHPADGMAWLAHKLAPWGESLRAGQIVVVCLQSQSVAAKAGDLFEADFGPLGGLKFKFV